MFSLFSESRKTKGITQGGKDWKISAQEVSRIWFEIEGISQKTV